MSPRKPNPFDALSHHSRRRGTRRFAGVGTTTRLSTSRPGNDPDVTLTELDNVWVLKVKRDGFDIGVGFLKGNFDWQFNVTDQATGYWWLLR